MRSAGKYFIAERLRQPKFRGELPLPPAQRAVCPGGAVPGAVAGEFRHRTRRRLQASPEREGSMVIIDRIPAELAGNVADAGVLLGQIDTALAGIGVDELILRIKGPVSRVKAKPVVPMRDGRIEEAAAVIDDGDGKAESPGLVQRILVVQA